MASGEAGQGTALRVAAGAAGAFVLVAVAVGSGAIDGLDAAALRALRASDGALPGGAKAARAVRDLTSLGSVAVLTLVVTLSVAGAWAAGRRAIAGHLLGVGAGTAVLALGLKALFGRARPGVVPHLDTVSTASFPSGHALGATAVYLTLGLLASSAGGLGRVPVAVAAAVAGCVGVTRCLAGVHFPSDVLAGWAAGAAWTAACWALAASLRAAKSTD